MRRVWPLLILGALTAGGCGQKGPLYLPDKGGKVVTAPSPAAAPPADAAIPAAPATPKPTDKDKDQDQSSPPPK
jgi:predicted small lipoprotein YifL